MRGWLAIRKPIQVAIQRNFPPAFFAVIPAALNSEAGQAGMTTN
jgi:hypothetical protein